MSTTTENRQPATPSSSLRRLVAQHPIGAFLVMIYTFTWTVFPPVVLQGWGLRDLPIDLSEGLAFNALVSIATIFGVALPAFLMTAARGGKRGVRDLISRSLRWRVGVRWYLTALLGPLAAMVLVATGQGRWSGGSIERTVPNLAGLPCR